MQFKYFQDIGRRHFEFYTKLMFDHFAVALPPQFNCIPTYKIWCGYFDPRLRYSLKAKLKMVAAEYCC